MVCIADILHNFPYHISIRYSPEKLTVRISLGENIKETAMRRIINLSWVNFIIFIEQECIEVIYCQYYLAIWSVISNTLPLWKKNVNTLPRVGKKYTLLSYLRPSAPRPLGPRASALGNISGFGVQIASGGVFSNISLLSAVYYYIIMEVSLS